jgi:hypothetical protein
MNKLKAQAIRLIPIASFCVLMAFALDYALIKSYLFITDPINQWTITEVMAKKAKAQTTKEMPVKLWVLNEVFNAGLNPDEADCIIRNESGWQTDAIGATKDYGLWQINIMHKKTIPLQDMFNYKEATEWSIAKRIHDGNWNAWMGWKNCK